MSWGCRVEPGLIDVIVVGVAYGARQGLFSALVDKGGYAAVVGVSLIVGAPRGASGSLAYRFGISSGQA